jgi:hypothetical protein
MHDIRRTGKRVVILLAEDDPGDQELTRRALENDVLRTELKIVEDGEEALDYLHRRGKFAEPGAERSLAGPDSGGRADDLQPGNGHPEKLRPGLQLVHPKAGGYGAVHERGAAAGRLLVRRGDTAPG